MGRLHRPALCRESLFTSGRGPTLRAVAGDVLYPRRLPHGECGAWGSAPVMTVTAQPGIRNMSKHPRILLTNHFFMASGFLIIKPSLAQM